MRVRQVDNALSLLELYARERAPLTLSDVARALGMPKSSAFNLIETLLGRGLLYETSRRAGYYPTRRLFDLAQAIMEGDGILGRIRGELEALAAATGETVVLSARDQDVVVYVDVVESPASIRYFARVGERRAIQTTASGKAILASYPPAERARILLSLDYGHGQPAAKRDAAALAADLDAAVARGWSEDCGESTPEVMGLGAPVLTGERRFGLAVAGPLYRMQDNRDALARCLIAAAERVRAISGA